MNCSSSATGSVPRRSGKSFKALRIPPAPQRQTDFTWRQFLRTPASTRLAGITAVTIPPRALPSTHPSPIADMPAERIKRRSVPGALINEYERAA